MRTGTVYLLHFARPLAHAQHYIGFSQHVEQRIQAHAKGRSGPPLIRAFHDAGIPFELARTWCSNQGFERHLKLHYKNARRLCPICKMQH